MGVWQAQQTMHAEPSEVLALLTDPVACTNWSPIPFELDALTTPRLETGTRARLSGQVAGRSVSFEVQITSASRSRLRLRASGPFEIAADYTVRTAPSRVLLRATVTTSGARGLSGRLLAKACDGLLAAGALRHALARIARDLEAPADAGDVLAAAA